MKIATWNVNSIRARLDRLLAWLRKVEPDAVCLQELKVADDEFPVAEITGAGYHAVFHGQRTYNGVAILSRTPLADVSIGLGDAGPDEQARLIAATTDGIRILSCYFPNGQLVGSDKWAYKLAWMGRLHGYLDGRCAPDQPLVVAGDFNVAPEDRDVARPAEWAGSVHCHEDARTALRTLNAWGLVDSMRLGEAGPGPYSWWDYRMLAFPKGNGLRIDHLFVTPPVAARFVRSWVDRDERKGKLPSDHAPVVLELAEP